MLQTAVYFQFISRIEKGQLNDECLYTQIIVAGSRKVASKMDVLGILHQQPCIPIFLPEKF